MGYCKTGTEGAKASGCTCAGCVRERYEESR